MRLIPKKTKIKTTIIFNYTLKDLIFVLLFFVVILLLFLAESNIKFFFIVPLSIFMVVCMIPTTDGPFYETIWIGIKYLFSEKIFSAKSKKKSKQNIDEIFTIQQIDEDGLILYNDNTYGRVLSVGQKAFGILETASQNMDIELLSSAIKAIPQNLALDLVRVERPVNFEKYSSDLNDKIIKLNNLHEKDEAIETRKKILTERQLDFDYINNKDKLFVSCFYYLVTGKDYNEVDSYAVSLKEQLESLGLPCYLPRKKGVAVFLKYNHCRFFDEHEVNYIKDSEILQWIKPNRVEVYTNRLIVDEYEETSFLLNRYPSEVANGWAVKLFSIPCSRVVMHMTPIDRTKAMARIDKSINELKSRFAANSKESETVQNSLHLQSMNDLLLALQSDNEALFDVSFAINAFNYYGESNYKKEVGKFIRALGFGYNNCWGIQREALTSFVVGKYAKESKNVIGPGVKKSVVGNYEHGIQSSSVAAAFPFVKPSMMDPDGEMLGITSASSFPFIFDMWKRDDQHQNSNAMVIGKSGSGKSFFLSSLITYEWSNGTKIIILDPEAEYLALTRNLHGIVIDAGNAEQGHINPFHIYNEIRDDGDHASSAVAYGSNLKKLESFFKIVFEGISHDVLELINNLVVEMYTSMNITEATDLSALKPEDFPTFSDLYRILKSHIQNNKDLDEFTKRDMRSAEIYLRKFVEGRYADLWNHPSSLSMDADIVTFNFQALFANQNNIVANAQMLLIFNFIEQDIINRRNLNKKSGEIQHTLIIADEAHLFIDAKFPIALDTFSRLTKRVRKYGAAFLPATQSISDWVPNEELQAKSTAIIKNSQYQFIFKLAPNDMSDLNKLYSAAGGFTKHESDVITQAARGHTFFLDSSGFKSSVNISVPQYISELFTENTVATKEAL